MELTDFRPGDRVEYWWYTWDRKEVSHTATVYRITNNRIIIDIDNISGRPRRSVVPASLRPIRVPR